MEAQGHVSEHLFFFPSVTFTCPRNSLHCFGYCIPMSYKSSLKSSCSNVQLIHTVHSAVLRHMLHGILVQPCSHVGSETWHQCLLAHIFFTSIDLNLLSNPIPLIVLSPAPPVYCSPLHELPLHESGKLMESSSPQSLINTGLLRPG